MVIFNFLIIILFFFSSSRDIIKNLPYYIYQIEDMNQYETKYLTEGNKFYIKLPKNIEKDTIFYLTIPKNVTLFPIYSSDFKEKPKDEEIINTDYKNEIQLKNKENEEYSIYSFNIEKSDSYKVLYFQNNEALNYLSLFASDLKETIPTYENLNIDTIRTFDISPFNVSYYKIQIDPDEDDFIIELDVYNIPNLVPNIELGYHFFNSPTDSDITNRNNYDNEKYKSDSKDGYERRTYELDNKNKYQYIGISITNKNSVSQKINITVKISKGFPAWAIVFIVGSIISIIIFVCCCNNEERNKFCEILCCCLDCFDFC